MQMAKEKATCLLTVLRRAGEERFDGSESISVRARVRRAARMTNGHIVTKLWEPTNVREAGSMLSMKQLNSRTALTSDISSPPMLDPQA